MKHDKIGTVYTSWDQIGEDRIRRVSSHGGIPYSLAMLFESGATAWVEGNGNFFDSGVVGSDQVNSATNNFTSDDWDLITGTGDYAPRKKVEITISAMTKEQARIISNIVITREGKVEIGPAGLRKIADVLEEKGGRLI